MQFTPFPVLTTERLVLRQLQMSDDQTLFSLRGDESVNRYLENFRHASIEVTREYILTINKGVDRNESIFWAICLKEAPRLIGTICFWNMAEEELKAEVGYLLHPAFQGKGLMQEALSKVIAFGFSDMGLRTVEAFTHRENEASIRLLRKNGFLHCKSLPENPESEEIIFKLEYNL